MCGCSMLIFAGWRSFPGGLLLGAERGGAIFQWKSECPAFYQIEAQRRGCQYCIEGDTTGSVILAHLVGHGFLL